MQNKNEHTQYWTDIITQRTATTVRLSFSVRLKAAWQHKADLRFELGYLAKEMPRVEAELRRTRKDDTVMIYRWTRRLARLQRDLVFFREEDTVLSEWLKIATQKAKSGTLVKT